MKIYGKSLDELNELERKLLQLDVILTSAIVMEKTRRQDQSVELVILLTGKEPYDVYEELMNIRYPFVCEMLDIAEVDMLFNAKETLDAIEESVYSLTKTIDLIHENIEEFEKLLLETENKNEFNIHMN